MCVLRHMCHTWTIVTLSHGAIQFLIPRTQWDDMILVWPCPFILVLHTHMHTHTQTTTTTNHTQINTHVDTPHVLQTPQSTYSFPLSITLVQGLLRCLPDFPASVLEHTYRTSVYNLAQGCLQWRSTKSAATDWTQDEKINTPHRYCEVPRSKHLPCALCSLPMWCQLA